MRQIKVAFLISTLNTGGAEKQLIRTINALCNDSSFSIKLYVLTAKSELIDEINEKVDIVFLNIKSYLNPLNIIKLRKEIRKFHPDIIHSVMYASNMMARFYKIFSPKTKVINHIHGLGSWIKKRHVLLDRLFLKFVDRIIVVSIESEKVRLSREKYPKYKLHLIHNCVDTQVFEVNNNQLNSNKLTIGVACRLVTLKQVDIAIKIFHEIRKYRKNTQLIIAGDGPNRLQLEKLVAELQISDFVQFLGNISNISSFYQSIDVFMLTSKIEDLPLTIVEALACGKPFIATNVGGIYELTNETKSLLISPNNRVKENAIEINDFLDSLDNNFIYTENRQYALDYFSIDQHRNKLTDLYQELIR